MEFTRIEILLMAHVDLKMSFGCGSLSKCKKWHVLKKFPASFLKIEVTATVYRSIIEVR